MCWGGRKWGGENGSISAEKADRTWIEEIAPEVLLLLLEPLPQRQVAKHLVAGEHHPTTAEPPADLVMAAVRGDIVEQEELSVGGTREGGGRGEALLRVCLHQLLYIYTPIM